MGRQMKLLAVVVVSVVGLAIGVACSGGGSDPEPTLSPTVAEATNTATPRPTRATRTAPAVAEDTPTPTATPTPFDGNVAILAIPSQDVASNIENIGLSANNQLETPHDPLNTGWYDIYDRPGWGGNAVFSAHVDYYPNIRGPFYDLADLTEGDEIVVEMEDRSRYVYEVFSNVRYDVATIPMGDIIWPKDRPESEEWITLITCGGAFQPYQGTSGPGQYLHRDVVVAKRIQ